MTKLYKVKTQLEYGRTYMPGDTVALDEDTAEAMPWCVEEMPQKAAPQKQDPPKDPPKA